MHCIARCQAESRWIPPHEALSGGLSIVVHDTANAMSGSGAKFLCADLALPELLTGRFHLLDSYRTLGSLAPASPATAFAFSDTCSFTGT